MSREEENEIDMDSIHLFDYLKKEIPIDELRDVDSPKRIVSIDFVKGFAIVFIMLAHTAGAWLNDTWIFIYGFAYAFLDILGPSLFVFLSALSVVFSIKRKKNSLSEKAIRNKILNRGIIIIVIGILFNISSFEFTIKGYSFPLNLWGWNILMFIGFSQIFSLYALKIGKMARAIIGALIIFTSDPIRQYLFEGKEAGNIPITILHYIFVSPSPMTPLLPYLSICFISTIFGEYLYDAMMMGKKQDYVVLFRIFLYWGLFFVIIGIFLGRFSYLPADYYSSANELTVGTLPLSEYPQIGLISVINSQNFIPEIRYPGMWEFLIRGRAPSMIYDLGAALLVIGISFYLIDIKKKSNNFTSMLIYYGKVS
ncbi:MAG: heparan-alpha-glucosaminide N-acetyltransferase domain-containing protein, partial [Candidatus Thorarchaeota archaeon]